MLSESMPNSASVGAIVLWDGVAMRIYMVNS